MWTSRLFFSVILLSLGSLAIADTSPLPETVYPGAIVPTNPGALPEAYPTIAPSPSPAPGSTIETAIQVPLPKFEDCAGSAEGAAAFFFCLTPDDVTLTPNGYGPFTGGYPDVTPRPPMPAGTLLWIFVPGIGPMALPIPAAPLPR